jgi:hypothetical protein
MKGRRLKKYRRSSLTGYRGALPSRPTGRYRESYYEASRHSGTDDFKNVVIYSVLGLGAATGLFFLARHFYNKSRKNTAEKKSLEEGSPATFAKQLNMAFDNDTWLGMGTDEEKVFAIFNQIPSKSMYAKVEKAYTDLYSKNLNSDLESELSSDEYNEVLRIISSKK